jgi:hypothetical protein
MDSAGMVGAAKAAAARKRGRRERMGVRQSMEYRVSSIGKTKGLEARRMCEDGVWSIEYRERQSVGGVCET